MAVMQLNGLIGMMFNIDFQTLKKLLGTRAVLTCYMLMQCLLCYLPVLRATNQLRLTPANMIT